MSARDLLGREIAVGDPVAKGMRTGNSGGMAVGRVTEIVNDEVIRVQVSHRAGWSLADPSARPSRWPVDTVVILRDPA